MQSAIEYLDKTESATRILFDAINKYNEPLRLSSICFVSSAANGKSRMIEFKNWAKKNKKEIAISSQAQQDYFAESFSKAAICGAVLQIALKAIERYSQNNTIPPKWISVIGKNKTTPKFCLGRQIRDIPIGLIIYAGRNQHMHFGDKQLLEPSNSVFDCLAMYYCEQAESLRDSAFDLLNPRLVSFASNIISLLEWHSYDDYSKDLSQLLGVSIDQ